LNASILNEAITYRLSCQLALLLARMGAIPKVVDVPGIFGAAAQLYRCPRRGTAKEDRHKAVLGGAAQLCRR